MRLTAHGTTDIGRRRSTNEDGFVLRDLTEAVTLDPPVSARPVGPLGILLAVCDGMGGHKAGEVASSLALETLALEMQRLGDACPRPQLFGKAVEAVNLKVWREASLHPDLAGMGTTLTAVLVCEERALIAQIGDSRAYFDRAGHLHQITRDQSIAGSLVANGQMTEEQAAKTPFRHVLLQAIGIKEKVEVALDGVQLVQGDLLLLCSDGLSNAITTAELRQHLAQADLKACADGLVALANERGGKDNITVVIARVD